MLLIEWFSLFWLSAATSTAIPQGPALSFVPQFEGEVSGPYVRPFLDPDSNHFYLVGVFQPKRAGSPKSEIHVLNPADGSTILKREYTPGETKCKAQTVVGFYLPGGFSQLMFIPGRDEILALACDGLFVLDKRTLSIKRVLFERELKGGGEVRVADDGAHVLVYYNNPPKELLIYDTRTWEVASRFPYPKTSAEHVAASFLGDSKSLAILECQKAMCSVQVRSLSGETQTAFSLGEFYGYPDRVIGRNGDANTFATAQPTSQGASLIVWDTKTKTRVREIVWVSAEGFVRQDSIAVSPDWKWAIGYLMQPSHFPELVILDLTSGRRIEGAPIVGRLPDEPRGGSKVQTYFSKSGEDLHMVVIAERKGAGYIVRMYSVR